MAEEKGRPLPKFGEWDVNDPASAANFTVLFNKVRDEKKMRESPANAFSHSSTAGLNPVKPKKWFCSCIRRSRVEES